MKRLNEIMLDGQVEILLEKERGRLFDVIPVLQSLTIKIPDTKDLWEHSKSTCAATPRQTVLRWAALFHDIGKPVVFKTSKGSIFPNHAMIGAEIWRDNSIRFTRILPQREIEAIERLIRFHMQVLAYEPRWNDQAVKRMKERYCGDMLLGIVLGRADGGNFDKLDHLKSRMYKLEG